MPFLAAVRAPDYAEALEILRDLPDHLEATRMRLHLSQPAAAAQIGVSKSVYYKLAAGETSWPSFNTITLCLTWLSAN